MKLKYIMELLESRTRGRKGRDVIYVEEDLFNMYDQALSHEHRYSDVASKKPNLMFHSYIISPDWMRPADDQPCCCCCKCRGCHR